MSGSSAENLSEVFEFLPSEVVGIIAAEFDRVLLCADLSSRKINEIRKKITKAIKEFGRWRDEDAIFGKSEYNFPDVLLGIAGEYEYKPELDEDEGDRMDLYFHGADVCELNEELNAESGHNVDCTDVDKIVAECLRSIAYGIKNARS